MYESVLINNLSEIKIKCIIKIVDLELFDVDQDINIDEDEWIKYGIMIDIKIYVLNCNDEHNFI